MKFRYLRADEIECRVSTITEKGLSLLLYKDARVDQNILDEEVGAFNWQRKHELINGNLFCSVGIYDPEKKEWVWKQDVGTESYTEKEKGQASDAFKRACFNWGIGRELYTAPFIWIGAENVNIGEKNDKKTTYDKFRVKQIIVDNGKITGLEIYSTKKNKVVFKAGDTSYISEAQYKELKELILQKNVNESALVKQYGIESLMVLPASRFKELHEKLIKGGKK